MRTIKHLADKLTISASSIRYYEKHGLLKVKRSDNHYRVYTEETEQQLKLIKIMKYAGFSLKEIKELLSVNNESSSETDCITRTNELLLAKREEIILKIETFKQVLELLDLMRPLAIAPETTENTAELNNLIDLIFVDTIKEH